MSDTQNQESPPKVLVVMAHPDDPEFSCGGTVALWAQAGREISYCLLTSGDKGADEPGHDPLEMAHTRQSEQRAAAAVLGVKEVLFLDYPDGMLIPDLGLRRDIVRVIRQVRPDIIISGDPTNYFPSDRYINHPDHRAAGQATLDAIFPSARSALYFPDLYDQEGLEPHKVHHIYLTNAQQANTYIDISATMELKLKALAEHRSQIKDFDELAARLRERFLDTRSPPEQARYIESFRRFEIG